jgi:hypothetical protein
MGLFVHCLWNASFEHIGACSWNVLLQFHFHDVWHRFAAHHVFVLCSNNGSVITDTSLVDHLKGITASEVDASLRMMQIVDDDVRIHEEELEEIGMMLDFLLAELLSMKNFQFIQALLQLFLKVCE